MPMIRPLLSAANQPRRPGVRDRPCSRLARLAKGCTAAKGTSAIVVMPGRS